MVVTTTVFSREEEEDGGTRDAAIQDVENRDMSQEEIIREHHFHRMRETADAEHRKWKRKTAMTN